MMAHVVELKLVDNLPNLKTCVLLKDTILFLFGWYPLSPTPHSTQPDHGVVNLAQALGHLDEGRVGGVGGNKLRGDAQRLPVSTGPDRRDVHRAREGAKVGAGLKDYLCVVKKVLKI